MKMEVFQVVAIHKSMILNYINGGVKSYSLNLRTILKNRLTEINKEFGKIMEEYGMF
jgi:hypothetical protein